MSEKITKNVRNREKTDRQILVKYKACRMAERLERATHNPQTLLSWVRVRFTVRADTCLVWDRWLYPVSRATRYTLFEAPDRENPCDGKLSHGPKSWNFVRNAIKWKTTATATLFVAPLTGGVRRMGSVRWRVTPRGNRSGYSVYPLPASLRWSPRRITIVGYGVNPVGRPGATTTTTTTTWTQN